MLNKKSIHLFLFLTALSFSLYAQDTYSALYEYTDSYDTKLESVLIIDKDESFFKILDERDSGIKYDENGEFLHYVTNDDISTIMYSDLENCFVRIPYPALKGGSTYSYKQNQLNWELTGRTKQVKDYQCQEALLNFHGRKYRVWFTPEISIHKGPLNLNGLPGLIIEMKELTGKTSFKLINIKKGGDDKLTGMIKDHFTYLKVEEYSDYEKGMKQYILELKIRKAKTIAEMLQRDGGTVSFSFSLGQYHWVRKIIDIPEGLIEELEKIDFYEE